jgi:DNA polymerase-3 subunit delta
MTSTAERTLWKSIQQRDGFAPVYYLYGEDDFLKDDAVRQLLAAAVEPDTRDFNLDIRDGAALDPATLATLLNTPPLMAARRVVVIRNVGSLKKDARQQLDRILAERRDTASDVVLVLVAAGGDKVKADTALARAANCTVEFAPLQGHRIPRWIQHHATTVLGTTVTDEAALQLQRAVGDDLAALAAELDKLASYTVGGIIDEQAVSAVVGVRHGETLGDFLDRVAARDATGALKLLPHILEQPKVTAVSVVMALTTQILALVWAQARLAGGLPEHRLEQEIWGLLKSSGGVYTGRPWGEAVQCWARFASAWDARDLDVALDALLRADVTLKETRLSSDEQILVTLVLTICASHVRRTGAAA